VVAKDLHLRGIVSYWGMVAPFVVLAGVLGALLWRTRMRGVIVGGTVVSTLLWLAVAFTPLTRAIVRPLLRVDPPAGADAIYVLASSVRPFGEPSTVALARATRGLELLGEGRAPRLLLGELGPPAGSYVAWTKGTAQRLGMARADDVESIGVIGNTHDEAVRVAEMFRARGWTRLLLVTSPTHTRRAAATFERAGVPVVISVPAMDTDVDIVRLGRSDDRLFAFGSIAHEWIGLAIYHLRGWI
jgi:uncharacterized SAM-binding protein YcdF (DUF218 family)